MRNNERPMKSFNDFMKNEYSTTDVAIGVRYWRRYLLSKCSNLFLREKLPETIANFDIERQLITKKFCVIVKDRKGNLVAPFMSSVYNKDVNMPPDTANVSSPNPLIGSKTGLKDGKDCVILWNSELDKFSHSPFSILWETICRYARMLADLDSTYSNNMIFNRSGLLAQAQNKAAATALNEAIKKLKAGDVDTVLNNTVAIDSIVPFNFQPVSTFSEYTDTRDFILGSFFKEIGLRTNNSQKKERMNTLEVMNPEENAFMEYNIGMLYTERLRNDIKVAETFGEEWETYMNTLVGGE